MNGSRSEVIYLRLAQGTGKEREGEFAVCGPCCQGELARTNGLRSEVIYLRPAHGTSKGWEREHCGHSLHHKVDFARTESALFEDL